MQQRLISDIHLLCACINRAAGGIHGEEVSWGLLRIDSELLNGQNKNEETTTTTDDPKTEMEDTKIVVGSSNIIDIGDSVNVGTASRSGDCGIAAAGGAGLRERLVAVVSAAHKMGIVAITEPPPVPLDSAEQRALEKASGGAAATTTLSSAKNKKKSVLTAKDVRLTIDGASDDIGIHVVIPAPVSRAQIEEAINANNNAFATAAANEATRKREKQEKTDAKITAMKKRLEEQRDMIKTGGGGGLAEQHQQLEEEIEEIEEVEEIDEEDEEQEPLGEVTGPIYNDDPPPPPPPEDDDDEKGEEDQNIPPPPADNEDGTAPPPPPEDDGDDLPPPPPLDENDGDEEAPPPPPPEDDDGAPPPPPPED